MGFSYYSAENIDNVVLLYCYVAFYYYSTVILWHCPTIVLVGGHCATIVQCHSGNVLYRTVVECHGPPIVL